MIRAVMVPLDGTVASEQALPFALAVARRTGAEIHPVLVHLSDRFSDLGLPLRLSEPTSEGALLWREEEYLASVADRLEAGSVRVHDPRVLRGEVADSLATHVRTHGIDGVVMSTHERGSVERFLIPSVAQALLHRLNVPILLHRFEPAVEPDVFAPVPPFRSLVAALDGSTDAEYALERALELTEPDARVVLVRVVEPPPLLSSVYIPHAAVIQREEEAGRKAEAGQYLDGISERRGRSGSRIESLLIHDRRPAEVITRVTADEVPDLVCMGSHGPGALRSALFGSVAREVLQGSAVPVLVARRGV